MCLFVVNLSTVFTEVPFLERFKKASEANFAHVECQFPYVTSKESIKKELERNRLNLILINLPPGNWEDGDRGLAVDLTKVSEFHEAVERGIEYATTLGCSKIHCMAGILTKDIDRQKARNTYIENIKYAANRFAAYQLTLLIEPINTYDMPGYFLNNIEDAVAIIEEVNLPNVKLQYDFYHQQRMQGDDLMLTFDKYKKYIGHVQIADVPGRHEPGTGKMNYNHIFKSLDELKYEGFIGLEYTPIKESEASFTWMRGKQ
ncbi:hydroxypyruvate isomerase family protein [Alkalihalobacterium elongatum]|uniref:hydroxypyruvate isomerase family protein n=1 Tax=Alkalihalobacterium elongatum TaxID=2675466 RepID=UPI001C200D6F|nr:hydroxypyruvate isomerase family protein [Alkalihalobacterium elongatum]